MNSNIHIIYVNTHTHGIKDADTHKIYNITYIYIQVCTYGKSASVVGNVVSVG